MPIVEFTSSERKWHAREVALGEELVAKARAEAQRMSAKTLADICESHDQPLPPSGLAQPVKNKVGEVVGLVWGREVKDWQDGKLTIGGVTAAAPPATTESVTTK